MRAHHPARSAHRGITALLAAATLAMTMAVAPALAAPPERVDEPIFLIFPDPANGVIVFWNTTREAFCAWEANDFEGDPPALQLVTASYHQVRSGPVIFRWAAVAHLELWTIDEGADLTGPCTDTDDSTEPWAVGTARAANNDNDLFHDESVAAGVKRTNSFGDRGRGTVWDANGDAWQYGWVFRAQISNTGDFTVRADHTFLHRRR